MLLLILLEILSDDHLPAQPETVQTHERSVWHTAVDLLHIGKNLTGNGQAFTGGELLAVLRDQFHQLAVEVDAAHGVVRHGDIGGDCLGAGIQYV